MAIEFDPLGGGVCSCFRNEDVQWVFWQLLGWTGQRLFIVYPDNHFCLLRIPVLLSTWHREIQVIIILEATSVKYLSCPRQRSQRLSGHSYSFPQHKAGRVSLSGASFLLPAACNMGEVDGAASWTMRIALLFGEHGAGDQKQSSRMMLDPCYGLNVCDSPTPNSYVETPSSALWY